MGRNERNARIGRRIRSRRKKAGIKQEALAEMVHASQQDISDWENGKRHVPAAVIDDIARALDCTPNDLTRSSKE